MYEFPSSEQIERYSFGDKIGKSPDLDSKPIICYDYIDLEQTKYHFHQSCFDQKDIKSYFKKLKDFSKKTINTLIDSDYREHFHLYWEPNSKIKKLLETINNGEKMHSENWPPIGQFALYTNENSSREKEIKSPRIYFILGDNAIFYILFYDPYHEINPGRG